MSNPSSNTASTTMPLRDENGHLLGCLEDGILTIKNGNRIGSWVVGTWERIEIDIACSQMARVCGKITT